MWTVVVEVDAPCSQRVAGMAQAIEQVLIQAFVRHAPIEAFHKTVLHRLSKSDVMSINAAIFLPIQDRVAEHHFRQQNARSVHHSKLNLCSISRMVAFNGIWSVRIKP